MATMDGNRMIPAKEIEGELWIKASDLYQACSAPVQEPVAWKDLTYGNLHHQDFGNSIPLYTTPPNVATLLVQEPVAWMYKDKYGNLNQSSSPTVPPDSFPVYTAAQRQWVGLTDAEVMQTMSGDWTSQFYFARAIEDKLKEKNSD